MVHASPHAGGPLLADESDAPQLRGRQRPRWTTSPRHPPRRRSRSCHPHPVRTYLGVLYRWVFDETDELALGEQLTATLDLLLPAIIRASSVDTNGPATAPARPDARPKPDNRDGVRGRCSVPAFGRRDQVRSVGGVACTGHVACGVMAGRVRPCWSRRMLDGGMRSPATSARRIRRRDDLGVDRAILGLDTRGGRSLRRAVEYPVSGPEHSADGGLGHRSSAVRRGSAHIRSAPPRTAS